MLKIWVNMFYKLGQLRFVTNLGKSVITKLGLVLLQIMTYFPVFELNTE